MFAEGAQMGNVTWNADLFSKSADFGTVFAGKERFGSRCVWTARGRVVRRTKDAAHLDSR
jgi:hypothetical protein